MFPISFDFQSTTNESMYLYFGDDDMTRAAAYLSGVLSYDGIPFERVDSSSRPTEEQLSKKYDAYILSDYPRSGFGDGQLERIRDAVREGTGLLMLGGWESFHGQAGEYHDSVLADVLPVTMLDCDDRRNYSQPVMLFREQPHPILESLPWETPPFIGGFNEFAAKPSSRTLLKCIRTDVRVVDEGQIADSRNDQNLDTDGRPVRFRLSIPIASGEVVFLSLSDVFPMLVVGEYGSGRTAALATDVAPHWVGGFVDWGRERITQELPGGGSIEVGADYANFFARLVRWVGGEL